MYSILLVDDEEAVRGSIRKLTPWKECGFYVISEASNGLEALSVLSENIPDVIITDIKMPYMDGIEFIKEVRARYSSSVQIIILSGYDEFTYAQTALKLDVAEYVLKPVSVEAMKEVLSRAKERIDADVARVTDIQMLESFYADAFEVYKEKFLVSLINPTRPIDEERILLKAKEYSISLIGSMFCIAVAELSDETLSSVMMEEIISEGLNENNDALSFQYENQAVLIFSSQLSDRSDSTFSTQVSRILALLQSRLIHYFSKPCNIGIGEIVHRVRNLPESYQSAMKALNYTSIYPEQHIISISDVEMADRRRDDDKEELLSELLLVMKFGNECDIKEKIHKVFEGAIETERIQWLVLQIISKISEICADYGKEITSLLNGEDLFIALSHANTLSRAEALSERLAIEANKMASSVREISHIRFVEKAKEIIIRSYSNPMFGLDQLSEEISVSPAYFSTTFKKEMGISFVQYLTNLRIEKAKELLKNTDTKTYEIARSVGFADPNYFSFTFRRNVGISPSQYRAQARS